MEAPLDKLKSTFEESGYDVVNTTRNRDTVEVVVREAGADADTLRGLTHEAIPESDVIGLDVRTASSEDSEDMNTVVKFRYRPD